MISGLYTAASGLIAQTTEQEVIANNLANVNTNGYKKDKALYTAFPAIFLHRLNDNVVKVPGAGWTDAMEPVGVLGQGVQLRIDGVQPDLTTEGSMIKTDNKLDFAIKGNGMFVVNTPQGIRYTRDGGFSLDVDGKLVTKSGYPVMGARGEIEMEGKDINIDDVGVIRDGKNELDTLRIAMFDKDTQIRKQGENLFFTLDGKPLKESDYADKVQVLSGYIESSNVNVVKEMVDMITAYRAYEASQKAVQAQDQTLNKAVNDVGNVTI
ncbi:MAG: flagellar hook-basal body protein [bacterium]